MSPDLLLVTSLNCGLVVGENIDDRLRASHVQFSQECRAHNIRRLIRDFAQHWFHWLTIFSKAQHLRKQGTSFLSVTWMSILVWAAGTRIWLYIVLCVVLKPRAHLHCLGGKNYPTVAQKHFNAADQTSAHRWRQF